jgi:FtsP/CotA-like multicopper oxidase with cupredoxin domain
MNSLLALTGSSNVVQDTLYINRGEFTTVDSTLMPYLAFNASSEFNIENKRIVLEVNDTLNLVIVNNDSLTHGFNIKEYSGVSSTVSPGSSIQISFSSTIPVTAIYYDNYNYPNNRYMGLAGIITVKNPVASSNFYWNIKEHQKDFNNLIGNGNGVDWLQYYPDYFTINGKSNPHINTDSSARIVGNIGDTIHVHLVNTGQSIHSLHFHGYHSTILQSSKFPNHIGRSKDTFPVYSMESVVLQLVPHQIGEYPVHDHNLVAVSGGNIYPNGMFTTILIQ